MEIRRIKSKKICPYCGGKAYVKRWNLKWDTDKVRFTVACDDCWIHSEPAETLQGALRNWTNENFSETQKKLTKGLDAKEIDEKNATRLVSEILRHASKGFRDGYRILLEMDENSAEYAMHKKEVQSRERDLIATIEYWNPGVTSGKDAVRKIKRDVENESR